MLLYHTGSWHYRLVLYIFTNEFFLETDGLDFEAMESQYDPQTKQEGEFKFIYKKKTKTINFCPYCRAVVAAITCLPFVYLWRLYPHKPKPKKTHAETMKSMNRKSWIVRILGVSFLVGIGIKNIIFGMEDNTYIIGIVELIASVVILSGYVWAPPMIRWIILHSPKWERKHKPVKIKKPREPSKIMQKIQSKHDVYCPPIFFVEDIDQEKLK